MSIGNFLICVFMAAVVMKSTEGQQRCRTPSGPIGHCIGFEKCSPFFKMSQQNWLTPQELNLIDKSWCGTINGVRTICCPIGNSNGVTKLEPVIPPTQPPPTPIIDLSTHHNANLLPLNICGKGSFNKIVGGNLTEPFEFPWMAMLRTIMSRNQLTVFCGGTLISNRYVLTAAHCLRTVQGEIKIHSVVLGEHDTNTNPDCIDVDDCAAPIQEIPVERSIPHPNFSSAKAKNDIGLVRLRRNVQFSDSVMPICIPYTQESQTSNYKRIIVSGWGGTGNGVTSHVLLKAVLNITSNRECSTIYKRYYYDRIQINENLLCAFGGDSDTCGGDSGGPAAFIAPTERFGPRMFQFGVVSAGARICGTNNGVPGLYTRVTSYAQWILDNISE